MSLFTRWVELLITQDCVQFAEVCTKLTDSDIVYKESIQHMGHGNRRSGRIGSLGESARYASLYQIYVKKKDLEYAKAVVLRKQ